VSHQRSAVPRSRNADWLVVPAAIILFLTVFGAANIYIKALNRVSSDDRQISTAHSVVEASAVSRRSSGTVVVLYALIT